MAMDLNKLRKVHFTGIGGVSMSALAGILLSKGIQVTGSDTKESDFTTALRNKGAEIMIGQRGGNISRDIDLVVYTAAVKPDNPEIIKAGELDIPVLTRADFLGEIMKGYDNAVCISGTHGKTTTTSLISEIMIKAGADPTVMVGGVLPSIGGTLRIGHSGSLIAEACEYTNSFLSFFPTTEIIMNVEADHLDFFKDLDDIRSSFRRFTRLLPEDGILIINGEIKDVDFFTKDLTAKVISFGLHGDFDFTAKNISYNKFARAEYDLYAHGKNEGRITLNIPGEYNIYNSLAAIAACSAHGISPGEAIPAVCAFTGAERRFQIKGSVGGVTIIDDYAHHPDEVKATLTAAKKFPHKKLWVVFQPHTYTRTAAFLDEFAESLSIADAVVLADIYAAREKNTLGVSSNDILARLTAKGKECYYFPTFSEIENFLLEKCVNEDVLITMGAGDVTDIGDFLLGK